MAKKYKYSFAGKKEVREGRGAIVLSTLALALFFISIIISYISEGNAGVIVGAFGLFSILCAVYGFSVGISVLKSKKKGHTIAAIGSISSGIVAILWLTVFLMGLK
ncbi:MAG: hypothetical protein MJ116_04975 [Lachnospiraceae bacterium]|nr:hypothetical protein [Lachnospiraceae bacterium]